VSFLEALLNFSQHMVHDMFLCFLLFALLAKGKGKASKGNNKAMWL